MARPTSPFYKMMQYNGKILNLGVNLETTTAVHIVEQVPGVYFPIRTSYKKKFNVKVTQKGCSQNLEILSLRPNLFRIRKVEY